MWHRFLSCVTRRMLLLSQGGWEKKRTFAAKLRCAENCGNKLRLSAFQLYNVCVVVNFPVNSIPKRNVAPPNIYGICREIEQSQFYLFRLIWHLLEDRKKKMIAPLQWKQHYYIISKCKRTRPITIIVIIQFRQFGFCLSNVRCAGSQAVVNGLCIRWHFYQCLPMGQMISLI